MKSTTATAVKTSAPMETATGRRRRNMAAAITSATAESARIRRA